MKDLGIYFKIKQYSTTTECDNVFFKYKGSFKLKKEIVDAINKVHPSEITLFKKENNKYISYIGDIKIKAEDDEIADFIEEDEFFGHEIIDGYIFEYINDIYKLNIKKTGICIKDICDANEGDTTYIECNIELLDKFKSFSYKKVLESR